VNASGKEQDHRHRIEDGDQRQRERTDRSLKVGSGRADQVSEMSQRADVRLGAPALGVVFGFLYLQAGGGLCLALTIRDDVGAIVALLVSDRHRGNGAPKLCRLLDGGIDLGDAPIKVSNGLTLNSQTSVHIGSSICQCQIDGHHMFEVGAREETERPDCVQPINTPIIATRTRRRSAGAEFQCSVSHAGRQ
jgi:hypothetical protein